MDNMTIRDFKSLILTKTDRHKKFWLKHLLNNNDTIKDLKEKTVQFNQKIGKDSEVIEISTKEKSEWDILATIKRKDGTTEYKLM